MDVDGAKGGTRDIGIYRKRAENKLDAISDVF